MSRIGVAATVIAAVLLLSGCASSATATSSLSATPSPSASLPAFLAQNQLDVDRLPDGVAARVGIRADTTRLQGTWGDHEVFLALKGSSAVCLVTGIATNLASWQAECGAGNEIVTTELPDGDTVKYLPMTSSATPQGWTKLSDFVFAM